MKHTLSRPLSNGRLAELFQMTKLSPLKPEEEALDKSYLESMIGLAAQIDGIDTDHLAPATHAFDVFQRLREDKTLETKNNREVYLKLARSVKKGLYIVPAVIE